MRRPLDSKEIMFAYVLSAYTIIMLCFLALAQFEFVVMAQAAALFELVALVGTLYYCYLAVQLYGRSSSEGRLWFNIIVMMVLFLIGLALSEFVSTEYNIFPYFAIPAFLLGSWTFAMRIRNAGLRPGPRDYSIAVLMVLVIFALISVLMHSLADRGLSSLELSTYWRQLTLVLCAFISVFLSALLGKLMGGYLSKGWYFLAIGAGIFAVTYSMITVLKAVELYDEYLWIETFQVIALNCVTFSAYFQRRRHLRLIA